MIDIDKPIQLRNINDNSIRSARVISSWSHGIIISHLLSTSSPTYWNIAFDGSIPEHDAWRIENAPPEPVNHTGIFALIDYRGSKFFAGFVDQRALDMYMAGSPGTCLASKEVTLTI